MPKQSEPNVKKGTKTAARPSKHPPSSSHPPTKEPPILPPSLPLPLPPPSASFPLSALSLPSPIHGTTHFLAAKKEISTKLGGKFDYVQVHKDLNAILETKENLSQYWCSQDLLLGSHIAANYHDDPLPPSCFKDLRRGGNTPSNTKHTTMNNLSTDPYPKQNVGAANSNKNRTAVGGLPGTPLNPHDYEEWDVDNLPLSFKVAFWRTHHPGHPTPQPTKPKTAYPFSQNNIPNNTSKQSQSHPHPLPNKLPHPPSPPHVHPHPHPHLPSVTPIHMPIMKVIRSPPLFSQNVTIQRTNIKPPELTKMGVYITPPHLLETQPSPPPLIPKQTTSTQTASHAHTQTSPATKIPKTDTYDFMSQTTSSNETQTTEQAIHPTTQTQTTSASFFDTKTVSIQTNPITDTIHTQTQPITRGVTTDTSDLPSTSTFISQIDTVPRISPPPVEHVPNKSPIVPNIVEIPPVLPEITDHLQQANEHHITLAKANYLEKRVLQMLCDKILTQMVQDHQVPIEIPAPPPPPPPAPPAPPAPSPPPPPQDDPLKRIIGQMIAEDLLASLNRKPPAISHEATQTKQVEEKPPPPPPKPNLTSFFSLSDTGILSHYFEPAPPHPPPQPPSPPSPSPPSSPVRPPPLVKMIESKSSQTVEKSDVGAQVATDVATVAIQADEAIAIGVQTIESVSTSAQYENPVKTVETAIQLTPPPSPKKVVEVSYTTDEDSSIDFSDGEMMKDVSDGEMVHQHKSIKKIIPNTLLGNTNNFSNNNYNKNNFTTNNYWNNENNNNNKYISEGELHDDYDSEEGEILGCDLNTQYSEGEVTLHPHESEGEIMIHSDQSFSTSFSRSFSKPFRTGILQTQYGSEGEM